MALNFGFESNQPTVQTADYKSAGSNQSEVLATIYKNNNSNYWEIHTVTTGKTLYISGITATSSTTSLMEIATGAAASEVMIWSAFGTVITLGLSTPMKFSSGTRLSVRNTEGTGPKVSISIIGWEE